MSNRRTRNAPQAAVDRHVTVLGRRKVGAYGNAPGRQRTPIDLDDVAIGEDRIPIDADAMGTRRRLESGRARVAAWSTSTGFWSTPGTGVVGVDHILIDVDGAHRGR